MARCRALAKKYFACMPLLLELGTPVRQPQQPGPPPQATRESLEEAQALFRRVKAESGDLSLARQALHMEALCALTLGFWAQRKPRPCWNPWTSRCPTQNPCWPRPTRPSSSRRRPGRSYKRGVYRTLCELFNTLPTYLSLCIQDPAAFRETWRRIQALVDAFQVKTLHPTLLLSVYLGAARGFLALGRRTPPWTCWRPTPTWPPGTSIPCASTETPSSTSWTAGWRTLTLGRDLPRDEALVRKSMTQALTAHPAFAPLADHFRFQALVGAAAGQ